MTSEETKHGGYRNDPSECGHGGTIHLGHGFEAAKQCKLCGQKFDALGYPVHTEGDE